MYMMKKFVILLAFTAIFAAAADAQRVAVDGSSQLYGYKNENGGWCINPQFQYAYGFQGGVRRFAVVKQGRAWGCIDIKGNMVVRNVFATKQEAENAGLQWQQSGEPGKWVYPLKNIFDGKWGFVNYYGQWKFEPQFEDAGQFYGEEPMSFAPVKLNGRWGCIDAKGIQIIEPIFLKEEHAVDAGKQWIHGRHYDTWLYPTTNPETGRWGFVNYLGRWIVEPKYTDHGYFGADNNYMYAQVKRGETWGNISRDGSIVSEYVFATKEDAAYALSQLEHNRPIDGWRFPVFNRTEGKWCYVNYAGQLAFDGYYEDVTHFANDTGDFATAKLDGYWCVLNGEGTRISIPVFVRTEDAALAGREYDLYTNFTDEDREEHAPDHWLFPIQEPETGHWGYVNFMGQWVIDPLFEDAKTFINRWNNRVAPAKLEGRWGCIDHTGRFVVKNMYNTSSEAFAAGARWGDERKF